MMRIKHCIENTEFTSVILLWWPEVERFKILWRAFIYLAVTIGEIRGVPRMYGRKNADPYGRAPTRFLFLNNPMEIKKIWCVGVATPSSIPHSIFIMLITIFAASNLFNCKIKKKENPLDTSVTAIKSTKSQSMKHLDLYSRLMRKMSSRSTNSSINHLCTH